PSIPGVGIVILAMILNSVGIPTTGIALIMGVDRILDMCRTAVNVAGDLVTCTVMDRFIGAKKEPEVSDVEGSACILETDALKESVKSVSGKSFSKNPDVETSKTE
ncbi:MAG: cation:dicarboxylase symporter family transporter, partial [Methanosarcinaceae archaeon]|nr:cation:dicarboxylase symporter family transporter [Methanosarcinaceae archaeon]